MNENLNQPQGEEAVATQPEEKTKGNQPVNADFKNLSFKEKLTWRVPPVVGWCVFAGALVLATGIALLILL